ncbi:hypothetical protein TIFTF001_028905 [Ficus carica]|uniref:Uncharacterized protein n=1 Tax=Ficus carica TaxID=3494 RepID=A0AA88J256_FICCA|nr:hypothetical protein TIFTF001_028905 [Ficus carica]
MVFETLPTFINSKTQNLKSKKKKTCTTNLNCGTLGRSHTVTTSSYAVFPNHFSWLAPSWPWIKLGSVNDIPPNGYIGGTTRPDCQMEEFRNGLDHCNAQTQPALKTVWIVTGQQCLV